MSSIKTSLLNWLAVLMIAHSSGGAEELDPIRNDRGPFGEGHNHCWNGCTGGFRHRRKLSWVSTRHITSLLRFEVLFEVVQCSSIFKISKGFPSRSLIACPFHQDFFSGSSSNLPCAGLQYLFYLIFFFAFLCNDCRRLSFYNNLTWKRIYAY